MEPIPETSQAIDEFGPFASEGDLLTRLGTAGERVRAIVPDCVGLSLASLDAGVTFTLVATDEQIAALDGVQYLAGGPCVESVRADSVVRFDNGDPTDERRWHTFARATAAARVVSTLTLPILAEGHVVGSVNLYAASRGAFEGHHLEVAEVFHAWAPGAVSNADLSFRTLRTAQDAPRILQEEVSVQVATGIVAAVLHLDVVAARDTLAESALRAGLSVVQLAETIVRLENELAGPPDHSA